MANDNKSPGKSQKLDLSYSGDRMLYCLGMPGLTHAERNVLAVIAWHDGPGHAHPSIQMIADHCGMKRSTANDHIQALRKKGRLSMKKTARANVYTVEYFTPCCQENPDSINRPMLSGNSGECCQGFPDSNRKNRNL